jgi:hypothetical protein
MYKNYPAIFLNAPGTRFCQPDRISKIVNLKYRYVAPSEAGELLGPGGEVLHGPGDEALQNP